MRIVQKIFELRTHALRAHERANRQRRHYQEKKYRQDDEESFHCRGCYPARRRLGKRRAKAAAVRLYSGVKVNVGLQDSLFEPMGKFVK